jgi:hypothetical protein
MIYGINAHLPSAEQLDRVRDAGIGWIRCDFNWCDIELGQNAYHWATTDQVVTDARSRGLQILACLAYTPSWANDAQGRGVPPYHSGDWVSFVAAVVERYHESIQYWGMWNEPNQKGFWSGSPEQYVNTILEPGAIVIRSFPGAKVCGPDLAMERDWAKWLETILSCGGQHLDIVTQHVYERNGREVLAKLGRVQPWWRLTKSVRQIMEATGQGDKPLWLTETGWNTAEVGDETQASYYDQLLEGLRDAPWLRALFFYELYDNAGEGWGILRSDLSPKPAYEVYARRIREAIVG